MNTAVFEFEKLEVYQLALRLKPIAAEIAKELPRGYGDLRSQLRRSERSIRLNIAEGAGRNSPGGKAERYRTARGSANECAACLHEIQMDRLADPEATREAISLLHRIVAMLTNLVISMESRS